jgi:1-acyl-sn-glycerol-3-phosphate acyltransferase
VPTRAMSTGSCAPRPDQPTSVATRCARLLHLSAHLGRMWLGARLRAPRLSETRRVHLMRRWAVRFLAVLRIEVRHGGHLPRANEPTLFVANHVSWLDSYALHTLAAARFVAKSEIAAWPVVGVIAARFGTVFIQRGSFRAAARTVGALAELLCRGRSVAVFPEATTSDGRELLPFFPAMFQAAVLTGARVHPVALRYRDARGATTTAAAYVGDMSIADSLRQLFAEPRLVVELIFCPPIDPSGLTRRELAAAARAAIAAALGLEAEAQPPVDTPLRRAA